MRTLLRSLAATIAIFAMTTAQAQNSTSAPLSSQKEETEGDPTGVYSRAGKLERGQEIVAGDDPADRRENVEKKAYRLT